MTIRFLRRWHGNQEGRERDWPNGAAKLLIQRGIAEPVNGIPNVTRVERVAAATEPDAPEPAEVATAKRKTKSKSRAKW